MTTKTSAATVPSPSWPAADDSAPAAFIPPPEPEHVYNGCEHGWCLNRPQIWTYGQSRPDGPAPGQVHAWCGWHRHPVAVIHADDGNPEGLTSYVVEVSVAFDQDVSANHEVVHVLYHGELDDAELTLSKDRAAALARALDAAAAAIPCCDEAREAANGSPNL